MTVTPTEVAVTLAQAAPDPGSITWDAWSQWITDALTQIRFRLGDPAMLDQQILDYVVREAVAAKVRNPQGIAQSSVTIDDGSISKTYSRGGSGQVTILDEWWAMLTPARGDDRGAWTIRPAGSRRRSC